ncbi:MAG: spore germination protein [Clostridia bacterium]|nr:spore germination protein [Clostridia bacterium]
MTNASPGASPGDSGVSHASGSPGASRVPPPAGAEARSQADYIVAALGAPPDLIVRSLRHGAILLFLGSLVDDVSIRRDVLEPMESISANDLKTEEALGAVVPVAGLSSAENLDFAIDALLSGQAALAVDGRTAPYLLDLARGVCRQVTPPISEPSVRGPRDAFTEKLIDNIALLRQRMRDRRLRVHCTTVGSDTHTEVAVCYMEGKASKDVVDEVIRRLGQVDAPDIIDSAFLVPYLTMRRWSLFPTAISTERADRACAGIVQGRVVVLCDNSAFALAVPVQLVTFFQASEDYYNLSIHSLLLRSVRFAGWIMATMAPGIYVGLASFNPGILPPSAISTLASSRMGVPYPPVVEVLIMDIALEMLSEASTRLPTYVGGAATVVGGLILGTAAAQAKLVSAVMIIVVAITAIGSFLIPNYQNGLSWRMAKYVYTAFAAFAGIYGIATAGLLLLTYLCSIDVLGVSYLSPFAPWRWNAIAKDTIMIMPPELSAELQRRQRADERAATGNE